jgi:hypothetical protein
MEAMSEAGWRVALTTPLLSKVEQTILALLDQYPDAEVSGRTLRSLLRDQGFRRTAPAFYFTMMQLEDKGLVACREEVRVVDEVEIRDRYYTRIGGDKEAAWEV